MVTRWISWVVFAWCLLRSTCARTWCALCSWECAMKRSNSASLVSWFTRHPARVLVKESASLHYTHQAAQHTLSNHVSTARKQHARTVSAYLTCDHQLHSTKRPVRLHIDQHLAYKTCIICKPGNVTGWIVSIWTRWHRAFRSRPETGKMQIIRFVMQSVTPGKLSLEFDSLFAAWWQIMLLWTEFSGWSCCQTIHQKDKAQNDLIAYLHLQDNRQSMSFMHCVLCCVLELSWPWPTWIWRPQKPSEPLLFLPYRLVAPCHSCMMFSVIHSVQWVGDSVACRWQSASSRRYDKILRHWAHSHEVIWEAAIDMLGSNTPAQISDDKRLWERQGTHVKCSVGPWHPKICKSRHHIASVQNRRYPCRCL